MNTRDDDALLRAAGAVADKTPVEWDREDASNPGLRAHLRQLRAIEALIALHAATPPDPLIGTSLSHYRVLEMIGAGGMGVVYKAEDLKLRRRVALKVLPPDRMGSEEHRARFLREARAAAAVTHPHIATIHEVGEEGAVLFIAMELIEGQTLRSRLESGRVTLDEAVRSCAEIAEGLSRAHGAHVIHRDLKPANVMLGPDGHVKILDFGLARLHAGPTDVLESGPSGVETGSADLTAAGRVLGTPSYMSPEQARGESVDARSDLFSLGVMLYEMVTGRAPFRGETPTETLSAIIGDDPVPAMEINPAIPPALGQVIGRCLEKDPRDRYQHAHGLAVDLRRLWRTIDSGVQDVPTARGPLETASTVSWSRWVTAPGRRRALAAGLAVVLISGALGTWRVLRPARAFESGDRVLVADFIDATRGPELGSMVRDAVEAMLSESAFLRVIRGEGRRELLRSEGASGAATIDREAAERLCRNGACTGYLVGRVGVAVDGFRVETSLYRTGSRRPVAVRAAVAPSEEQILMTTHGIVLDLRRRLGESSDSLVQSIPPTTRSLPAYQLLARAQQVGEDHIGLLNAALKLDPEFVEAYRELAYARFNIGDFKGYRDAIFETYRRSSALPGMLRLQAEIDYLDASYDFDAETERLKAAVNLYPLAFVFHQYLGVLYRDIFQDVGLAEKYDREAYGLSPNGRNLENLCWDLRAQGRADPIERAVADFAGRGGLGPVAERYLLLAHILRGDEQRIRDTMGRLRADSPTGGAFVTSEYLTWLLATGRLAEARQASATARAAATNLPALNLEHLAALRQAWLESRRTGAPPRLGMEQVRLVRDNLLYLPQFAAFSVDVEAEWPLSALIARHEEAERGSTSRFVREELNFARACLAVVRGEPGKARPILEVLARSSLLTRRHHMLGRAYEGLGMWREAAQEFEQVLENPHLKWYYFEIPAVQVLEQFRLAGIYERLGDTGRARHWYERFLADWKDADPDIPEVLEARKRLAALGGEAAR